MCQLSPWHLGWFNPPNVFDLIQKDENGQFPLKLTVKEAINHDTYKMTFEFPNPEWIMGIFPGGHVFMTADIDGKKLTRKYTQISPVN